jgi:small subunit ribosomal protein S4
VNHGHIRINGQKVDRASYRVRIGDHIEPKPKSKNLAAIEGCWKHPAHERPNWLVTETGKVGAKVDSLPTVETLLFPIDINLVLEYYAKRM